MLKVNGRTNFKEILRQSFMVFEILGRATSNTQFFTSKCENFVKIKKTFDETN